MQVSPSLVATRMKRQHRAVWPAGWTLFLCAALISGCTAPSDGKAEAETALKQGIDKLNKGDHVAAAEDLTRAIKINPTAEAYYYRSNARQELNDYKGAINDLTEVINTSPDKTWSYYNRGIAKGKLGDDQGAIDDYTSAITLNPKFAQALLNRGNARLQLDHFEQAVQDYDKALQINPNLRGAYVGRGIAKELHGNLGDACPDYRQAADLGSKKAAGWVKDAC